jgi:hypothetical protein
MDMKIDLTLRKDDRPRIFRNREVGKISGGKSSMRLNKIMQ